MAESEVNCSLKKNQDLLKKIPIVEIPESGNSCLDVVGGRTHTMRPEAKRIHFLGPLVVDPLLDGALGENSTLHVEAVVHFEVIEYLFVRTRHGRDRASSSGAIS